MSTRWASGRPVFRAPEPAAAPASAVSEPPAVAVPSHAPEAPPTPGVSRAPEAERSPRGVLLASLAERASAISAEWAPTAGRILLGVVFFWFGYHELIQPGQWTQYVPVVSESSSLAVILVLAHGWVLFVTATALVAGISPRVAAAIASVLMLEIVISLAVTGLSDTALRDVGVLGLAICLTGCQNQRLVLRN